MRRLCRIDMTLKHLSARPLTERERIDMVIAEYGVLRVLQAALLAAIRKKPARVARASHEDLSPHLRRDIGLPLEDRADDYTRYL